MSAHVLLNSLIESANPDEDFIWVFTVCMCGSRGGTWSPDHPPPLKNHKNIGFLSNTGPIP